MFMSLSVGKHLQFFCHLKRLTEEEVFLFLVEKICINLLQYLKKSGICSFTNSMHCSTDIIQYTHYTWRFLQEKVI